MNDKQNKVVETQQTQALQNDYGYGFCGNYHHVFKNLEQQAIELFAFNPKHVATSQRFQLEKSITFQEFDHDNYIYDKMSNSHQIDPILASNQASTTLNNLSQQNQLSNETLSQQKFKSQLKIPNKELLISKTDHQHIWKQIFSIVFSYLYELVCMQGEFGVQSAKTINKTSPVLSANLLFKQQNFTQVVYSTCRRCLTYSLYRHLEICQKVLDLLKKLFSLHLCIVVVNDLRFLFQISQNQPRYLLNTIFLNDYCVYLMSGPVEDKEKYIRALLDEINGLKLAEDELELDLRTEQSEEQIEFGDQKTDDEANEKKDLQILLNLD